MRFFLSCSGASAQREAREEVSRPFCQVAILVLSEFQTWRKNWAIFNLAKLLGRKTHTHIHTPQTQAVSSMAAGRILLWPSTRLL